MSNTLSLYRVNDNILTLPSGEKKAIIDSRTRATNPIPYFRMRTNSPFGLTLLPMKFYKKTLYNDWTLDGQIVLEAITELIIPPMTWFHVENGDIDSLAARFRFERAIVGNQIGIANDEKINETKSMYDYHFRYRFGDMVEPLTSFYCYDQWVKSGKQNATNTHGIHAFQSREQALLFDFYL
jgi:hypothetical protein